MKILAMLKSQLIKNTNYIIRNASIKVGFLPSQSAKGPKNTEPIITPAMYMLIVLGAIIERSQTNFHSET